MKGKRSTKQARVAKQSLQVAALAPVVASARLVRLARTGNYDALGKMGTEKVAAFTAATVGMMFAGAAAVTRSAFVWADAWSPWGGTARQRMARVQSAMIDGSADIARGALTPIRKRVVANSRRLGR
jgi:hypothetical protein